MSLRKRIISTPGYWIEKVNMLMHDAILSFKNSRNMKNKDLAKYLELSEGRVSQILNTGETNFTVESLTKLSLKIGKVPEFNLIDINDYLQKEREVHNNRLNSLTKKNYQAIIRIDINQEMFIGYNLDTEPEESFTQLRTLIGGHETERRSYSL